MTELDLGLKCGARALLWTMGYSTRLDVVLRGEAPPARTPSRSRSAPETFTDLDVLGVLVTGGYELTTTIADCKSGQRDRSTARMFWARGVADFFGANQVMLVREHDVNDATRQLSSRLGITVVASPDLAVMQSYHGPALPDTSPLTVMFDRVAVAKHLAAFDGLDRRLKPLLEYRQYDYWVYEDYRNVVQLVAHLRDAVPHLDASSPIHIGLFLDLAWLYLLTLVKVTQHIRGAFLRDPDRGLQEYLFGGPTGLREKEEAAALLRSVAPVGTQNLGHLPPYYPNLRELVLRLLRRPAEVQKALRYLEAAAALTVGKVRVPLDTAIDYEFDPIAAKLAADVCGFLVAATDLSADFRVQARAYLLAEPVHQVTGAGVRGTPETGKGDQQVVVEQESSGDHSADDPQTAEAASPTLEPLVADPEQDVDRDGAPE